METIHLFHNDVYKFRIDPKAYDKAGIIATCERNYAKSPYRNEWDEDSNIHHFYNDWNNTEFERVDTSSVLPLYKEVVDKFVNSQHYKDNVRYEFGLVNTTATKGDQNMRIHNHETSAFSCVHYISLKEEHRVTRFFNPMVFAQYRNTWKHVNPLMQNMIDNSSYFHHWDLRVEEDDMLIFPAYLNHEIPPTPPTDTLRITNVLNINIYENTTL